MTLKCPRTQVALKELNVDGILVDISEGCGGVWLDNREIKKLDEAHEKAGDSLVELLEPFIKDDLNLEARIKCPKCPDSIMMRNFYSPKRCFQIDTCPTCAGVWLDPGELTHLRSLFKTEEERCAYGTAFVNEVTAVLDEELKKSEAQTKQVHAVAQALRFITPSYYLKNSGLWKKY